MKHKLFPLSIAVLMLLIFSRSALADPLGTAFTYQGQLKSSGAAYTGTCDMQFSLFDALAAGTQIGTTQTLTAVTVTSGLFTVELDFGANVFTGEKRYLEIAVKCGADASYTTLSPRQQLTAVPYAVYAPTTENFSGNLAGDVTGAQSSTTVEKIQGRNVATTAPTNGQVLKWNGSAWEPATDKDTTYTAGAGLDLTGTTFSILGTYQLPQSCSANQIAKWNGSAWACANDDGVTSAWLLTGNSGTDANTNFLGTTDGVSLTLRANNTIGWRLSPSGTDTPNIVGGYSGNSATSGIVGATIGGGGASGFINQVTSDYALVAGGRNNSSNGFAATVGGGQTNTTNASYSTVSGGFNNSANSSFSTVSGGSLNTADATSATVGGGTGNTASGGGSTVGGGSSNLASGSSATVGGGANNTAAGDYSFVVGRRAKNSDATHDGVFLFADSTNADFSSTAANQFRVRSTGGAEFITNSAGTTGVTLSAGGGSWASVSDRNAKQNFSAIDAREILQRVAQMPILKWNYKTQDARVQHIGPMAQDFYAAFNVGEDEKHITTVDADGVSLAAIQGLNQIVNEQNARIDTLEKQNASLEARLTALEQSRGTLSNDWYWISLCAGIVGASVWWMMRRDRSGELGSPRDTVTSPRGET